MRKNLSEILKALEESSIRYDILSEKKDCEIEHLEFDSRAVKEGTLFFALPGTHTTGNVFIESAVKNGASAIVFQDDFDDDKIKNLKDVVFVRVKSSRFVMSPLSSAFYDNPSKKLVVYGVTGTEGKSSTVSFIWQLLRLSGIKAGFFSTVEYSLGGDAVPNPEHQTTPEATIVQRELYEMVQNGCTHAVVECSSHGLSERTNRLGDVLFDVSVFMNVTLEHLEFHGTFEQYRSDKANLFRALEKHDHKKNVAGTEMEVSSFGIVNADDKSARYFSECTNKKVISFSMNGDGLVSIKDVRQNERGIVFDLETEGKKIVVETSVQGNFNAYNLTAAIFAVADTLKKPLEEIASLVPEVKSVKGRMTRIDEGQDFGLIVDYAHTPSSFEAIFPAVRKRIKGNVICVFGSGGERDTVKRPLQGVIAAEYSDFVVLADEDPRKEDRMKILEDIAAGCRKKGMLDGKNLFLIPDRMEAIRKAFSIAKKGDIVLLLGKAHENSIIYAEGKIDYDEISTARRLIHEFDNL